MKQNIIFFGSGWFVIPVIKKLTKFNLQLVITNEANGKVVEFCIKNNIPYIASDLKDGTIIEKIKNLKPSVAVLASYGAFIPASILKLFPSGIINIHPSLLPKWKGPSPVQYQLLNGDSTTGVTLITLDDQIDHGPILSSRAYQAQGNETAEDLLTILFEIGADLIVDQIMQLEDGKQLIGKQQDHTKESWSYKIEKKDGMIDLNSLNKNITNTSNWEIELDRKIRAFYPWPGVWFLYKPDGSLTNTTNKLYGKIIKLLPNNRIQIEGKNPMSLKDFINGFGNEGKELLEKIGLN